MEILLLTLPVLLFSVVVHEYAHAWMAMKQGDPTAERLGRLTLNPLPHIDPFGSIFFPLMLALTQAGVIFGWARPVPVDPRNFRHYRRGDILVSLAGVGANFVLAVGFTVAIVVFIHVARILPVLGPSLELLIAMARFGVLINLVLAFFNLIPIPPLDGSHVVYHLLPRRLAARYREISRYGMLILLAILIFARPVLIVVFGPVTMLRDVSEALIRLLT